VSSEKAISTWGKDSCLIVTLRVDRQWTGADKHLRRFRALSATGGNMKLLDSLRFRIATLFRRSEMNAEIEEELRAHIQHRADDLERCGMDRTEAERRARYVGGHGGGFGGRASGFPGVRYRRRPCSLTDTLRRIRTPNSVHIPCDIPQAALFS
jgi:hypothetical protein